MKFDPYQVLRVRKNASAQAIQKAYRKLAMETHPDRGGNRDEFQKIQLAYDVLADDERRARYDATGEVGGGVDNSVGMVMAVVAEAFAAVARELLKHGVKPDREDMAAHLRAALDARAQGLKEKRAEIIKAQKFLMATIGRFQTDGENLLEQMLQGQVATIERNIKEVDSQLVLNGKAVKAMEKYRFRFEASMHMAIGGASTTASSSGFLWSS